ncbi:ABC transporter permease [Rhodococcus sp. NPDC056960]|uniref:ABC transporter permease n=1 Tax=Rhodococcus sp. NPDC056960 TaxID=3345982 RepID=UPI0036282EC4
MNSPATSPLTRPSSGSTASPKVSVRTSATSLLEGLIGPVVTIVIASFVVFTALSFAPGDPVSQKLGARATDVQRAALRAQLGLDQPLPIRYWHWLVNAAHGDFGSSMVSGSTVSELLAPRIATTIFLVVYAGILVLVVGFALGTVGAMVRPLSSAVAALTGLAIAIPSYVAATLLVAVFSLSLGWFPVLGSGTGFADRLWHLTLPAIALAVGWSAFVTQITAASLRQERLSDHVETALSRGIPPAQVFRRHILRNAAVPIVTTTGTLLAGLVAGSVVVETAFGLDGLGSLLVTGILSKDYNVVTAISLILVVVFVISTAIVTAMQRTLDPRIREGVKP